MADYDLIIVGSGPGGYVAAIRAAQLGINTAVIERDRLGGVCLNWGCIPTKALLRNAEVINLFQNAGEWGVRFEGLTVEYRPAYERSRRVADRLSKGVAFLLKKNGVEVAEEEAELVAQDSVRLRGSNDTLSASHLLLATGSSPAPLPGVEFDGERILHSDHAVVMEELPSRMVIIGAGAVGVEFAHIFHSYGCEVDLIEMMPRILPLEDEEVSDLLAKVFIRRGLRLHTGTKVEAVERRDGLVRVTSTGPDGQTEFEAEKILVAIGRRGNTENLGLEPLRVKVERGSVKVDGMQRTSAPGIYAIGDLAGLPHLAHKASHEGIVCVEAIAGEEPEPVDGSAIPSCTYCQPQVASMGLTEAQARATGREVQVGRYPFSANGKALALGDHEGFVKIVADAEYGELLGVHMIGPEVTEILHEFAVGKKLESTPLEIGRTIHAHPTLSEAVMESALDALGLVIHV